MPRDYNVKPASRYWSRAGNQTLPRRLVTDAVHMRRAQQMFRYHGFETMAAPTTFMAQGPLRFIDFVPHARELARSNYALHEWIGLLWYRLRHL